MIFKKNNTAFSFIEILVVVTIIGIIASVGMVTYTEFIKQSRDAKRKGDIENIRGAIEMYKSKNNTYPLTVELDLANQGSICDPSPGDCDSGTYLQKLPKDPKSDYIYYYTSDGTTYVLGTYLEQGGTSDCGTNNCGVSTDCNYCMGPYGQL